MRRITSFSFFSCALILFLASVVFSVSAPPPTTWTGANSNDWGDPGNWTAGTPSPGTDVTIAGALNLNITNIPTIALNSLTINASALVTLQSVAPATITVSSLLNISSDVTIGSALTIESVLSGSIAASITLSVAGTLSVFSTFSNSGICLVQSGGTFWVKSATTSVFGNDISYSVGSLLRYEYINGGGALPNTGSEIPTLPNVMNGNVLLNVDPPSVNVVAYKMNGNKRITGVCNFTQGGWLISSGSLQLDGAVSIAPTEMLFGGGGGGLTIGGSGALTGIFNFFFGSTLTNITMNRVGANLVFATNMTASNSLNLIAGTINCATNSVDLYVQNTSPTAVTGGHSNSYVITASGAGTLRRAMPSGSTPGAYKFPVGTVSGYFPFTLIDPNVGAPVDLQVGTNDVAPSAPIISSQYLTVSQVGGPTPVLDGQVLLESPLVQAGSSVAANTVSPLPLSAYTTLTSSPVLPGVSVQTSTVVAAIGSSGAYYFALAGAPTPPYVWAGAPGANWQTPSSWTPPRNNPAVTDELIFNIGTHTPTNVPHETVSMLTIKNGATVTLSASNPNNWLTTTAMPYGVIVESGGKLDLGAPATNIALNISSTSQCKIDGTLQTQNSAVIGAGFFSLSSDALLATTRDDGINGASVSGGAIQTAFASYNSQARYEFTSASTGAERDMNFKQRGGKSGITFMRALYVGASAGTRRLNSAITVGGLPPLLAFSKSDASLQSASASEAVIKGRMTLHSALNSALTISDDTTPLIVRDGAELWNNGQISFLGISTMVVDNAFLTMVGPNGGGGTGTGRVNAGSATMTYSGASMLSFTGGGAFTTTDFLLPSVMPVVVSVSNASVVALNSSKTLQAGLILSSDGKVALNDQNVTLNGLNTSSGAALRGTTLSGLTLNGTVQGNLAFESGFATLNSLTLGHTQTTVPALSGTLNVLNSLTLQSGILAVAAPNTLTLSASSPSSLSGGSATSYIRGALLRTMQSDISSDGQSYLFPVGDNSYRPFTLANVRTGSVAPTVLGQSFSSGASSWTMPLTSGAQFNWLAQTISGDFLTGTFQVGAAQSPIPTGLRIATATAQAGSYGDIGADDVSPVRSSLPQAATASASGTYFALGGAVPSILSFTPRVARPGQTVTITGQFLSSATGVTFGGIPAASFTVVSPTQITAVVGAGASGSLQVQSPLGTVAAPLPFTWTGQPTITSVSPSLNVVGQVITILGTEYHTTPAVSIGTLLAASVTAASLTELRVVFAQATTGILTVNASGGTVSWQQPLTVFAAPTITNISSLQPLPGALLTVTGTNFAQGLTQVSIGGAPVQATVNSPTQITVVAPQSANGLLQITTPAGMVASSAAIVIIPPPTIASALPTSPQVGETISMVGTNYINVQTVSIGGIPTTFTVNSPTNISAIAPPFTLTTPTSTATVSVTTRSGTAVYSRTLTLRQAPEPVMTLTGFSPQSVVEGQAVTVTGLNVPPTALLRLRSVFASVNVAAQIQTANNGASTISFNAPSGLIPQNMVSTEATMTAEAVFPSGIQTAQAALPLTIRAADAPMLTNFSPNIGGTLTTIIISGQNFNASTRGSIQAVFIGGLPVREFTVLSPTQIRVAVGQVASGALTMQTGSGLLSTSASFTFNPILDAEAVAPSDSLALNALYAATNGVSWTNATNWTNGYPVALRFGVKVERGRVVELSLLANNLDGTLPWTALANLTALRVLNLAGNSLGGGLPQNVCSMASLKTLNLSNNRFEGGIEALCCLPAGLENINFSGNQLSGFLPECLKNLGNLQIFDASQNRFIGGFPTFLVQLPSLQILNLRGNRLSGILPPSLGVPAFAAAKAKNSALTSTLTSVEGLLRLDIGGNDFSGNIPAEMDNLVNMRGLFLDGNRFAGAVPESFTKLIRLDTLNLADNILDDIPNLALSTPRLTLNVRGNRLPLSALEPLVSVRQFTYAPQTITPPRLTDTTAVIDAPFALRAALAGANNRYQWRKNGSLVRTASASDALEFIAFAQSDAGEYVCEITNTKLPLLMVSTASVRVQAVMPANVPDTVALIAPAPAETDVPTLPLFVWRTADGAGQYRVEISASANFSSLLTTLTIAQTATALASGRVELDTRGLNGFPLLNETRYFWRVRAENARGEGGWTSSNFTTAANNTLGAMRLDFGKIPRGDTAFGVLTLRNLSETRIRLTDGISASHPSFVCEDVRGREIPAGAALPVRVRFTSATLETVNAALTLRFTAEGSTVVQTQTIANRLLGRGGALKLIPPAIDTSVIGTTKLLAVQVVNVGDRETELIRVQLQRGTREYSFRAEVDGKAPVGVGDTTAVLLRFTAERTGAASAQEVYCQATVDTVTTPLVQYGRAKLPTDVVAKLGLRAVPANAPPGAEVMVEIYLDGLSDDDRVRLFKSSIPNFSAALRFNRNVLALGATSVARPVRNATLNNSSQRCAVPTTFWNGTSAVLLRIPCRAVAGNTDTTALVLEELKWGDGTLQIADVLDGSFKVQTSQAGGKRLISGTSNGLTLVSISPNPTADVLHVVYTLGAEGWTELSLLDIRGNMVQSLTKSLQSAGEQSVQSSLKNIPSGTYMLRLESGGEVVTRRVEVVR